MISSYENDHAGSSANKADEARVSHIVAPNLQVLLVGVVGDDCRNCAR